MKPLRPLSMLLAATAALLLAACAAFSPRSVTVSESQLMEMIAEKFPARYRLLDFFDLTITAPQLRLQPEDNRLATRFEFIVNIPSLGARLKGITGLSYGLRYDYSDDTIRLADVRLESFEVPGLPLPYVPQLRELVGLRVGELLNDRVVYKVSRRNRDYMERAELRPSQPRVTQDGVELLLNKRNSPL